MMRSLIDLVESAQSPRTYFHVTWTSRLAAIRRDGLVLGKRRNWKTMFGVSQGSREHVYLMSDFTQAVRWAHRMEWDQKRPVSILVLNDVPGAIERDPHPESSGWVMTDEAVPPSCIERVIPATVELYRQVVNGGTATLPD